MNSLPVTPLRLEVGVRWTARVLAVLLVGMVLWFLIADIAEGGTNPVKLNLRDAFNLTWLFTACIGMVVAWRWPLIGGGITTAAILLYYAVSLVTGSFLNNLYFNLMLLAGILFMVSAFVRRRKSVG